MARKASNQSHCMGSTLSHITHYILLLQPCLEQTCELEFDGKRDVLRHWARTHHSSIVMFKYTVNKCRYNNLIAEKVTTHLPTRVYIGIAGETTRESENLNSIHLPKTLENNICFEDPQGTEPLQGFRAPLVDRKAGSQQFIKTVDVYWWQVGKKTQFPHSAATETT